MQNVVQGLNQGFGTIMNRTRTFKLIILFLPAFALIFLLVYHKGFFISDTSSSTNSNGFFGRKALYNSLSSSGVEVHQYTRRYSIENLKEVTVLVAANMSIYPDNEEIMALKKWVKSGGVLILDVNCGSIASEFGYGIDCAKMGSTISTVPLDCMSDNFPGVTNIGPFLVKQFANTPDKTTSILACQDNPVITLTIYGEGRIYLLPIFETMSNRNVLNVDNRRFSYLAFRYFARHGTIHFDEYHNGYGYRSGETVERFTLMKALFSTQYGVAVLMTVFAGFFLLFNRDGVRVAINRRATLGASPLAFTEAAAGLYERAGAFSDCLSIMIEALRIDLVSKHNMTAESSIIQIAQKYGNGTSIRECLMRISDTNNMIVAQRTISGQEAIEVSSIIDRVRKVELVN